MTKVQNALYHVHNGNYDAKFLTDSLTGERILFMDSPIGLLRRPFNYEDFDDMLDQNEISYTPITAEAFQEHSESVSDLLGSPYNDFVTYYKDGKIFKRYGLTFSIYQNQFIVDLAGRQNDAGLRLLIADTESNRKAVSGHQIKLIKTLGSDIVIELGDDTVISDSSEREKRMLGEIKQLKSTGLGIIGMVKSVEQHREDYPELSRHSFYDIREMLS